MDAVLSFALEHVTDSRAFVCAVHGLLKEGVILFLVPNIFANTADLVVAGCESLLRQSLQRLLVDAGFHCAEINGEVMIAWVVVAEKGEALGLRRANPFLRRFKKWRRTGTSLVIAFRHSKAGSEAAAIMARAHGIHSRELGTAGSGCVFPRSKSHRQQQVLLGNNRIAGSLAGNSAAIVCRANSAWRKRIGRRTAAGVGDVFAVTVNYELCEIGFSLLAARNVVDRRR